MNYSLPKNIDNRFMFIPTGRRFTKKGILGLIRERNESLILKDTLDHFAKNTDGVILLDDSSDDNSVAIALSHPIVIGVILNTSWSKDRALEETTHRALLHNTGKSLGPKWFFYADADERFEGNIKAFLSSRDSSKVDGVRISLFDSYLTKDDHSPYKEGTLSNFRKYFGPERRDILMIWRNQKSANFIGLDAREPTGIDTHKTITKFYCQHYGKALSEAQWEETCRYYSESFPMYSEKWNARKGKSIHTKSDFNNNLYTWDDVKSNAIKIHPL